MGAIRIAITIETSLRNLRVAFLISWQRFCSFILIASFFKYTILVCLFISTNLFSQAPLSLDDKKAKLNIPHALTRDPVTLSKALTAGLSDDKQKFDAIFTWVAGNIDYNWNKYFSSRGTGRPDVNRILRRRAGICMDYAFLMDTLCTIANLTNVTVTGYAKDELFNVTDSLYIGNHAWNAVKLNNEWYLYDVTFSTGRRVYDYTAFSKLIIKLRKKLPFKLITRRIVVNPPDKCCDTAETIEITRKIPRMRLLWWLLYKIHLHAEPTFDAQLNTDFYLCEPRLFATTHYPENPVWNLLSAFPERSYEEDSTFYHLQIENYQTQTRKGSVCTDCDNAIALQEIPKYQYEKKQTLGSNKRNNFAPGLHNFYISSFYFRDSKKTEDSLEKVTRLDSALTFLTRSRTDFSKGITNIDNEFSQQKSKNRRKYNLLFDDNKQHLKFFNEKLSAAYLQRKNLKELSSKIAARVRSCDRKENLIRNMNRQVDRIEKSTNTSLIEQCHEKIKIEKRAIDSIAVLIDSLKKTFEQQIRTVSSQVWVQVMFHDSLVEPYTRSIQYRMFGSDNLKKDIVETKKQLSVNERNYDEALRTTIYEPSEMCVTLSKDIFNMIDARYALQKSSFESHRRLVKLGDEEMSRLKEYQDEMQTTNLQDYCWLKRRTPYLKLTYKGLKALRKKQETVKAQVRYENYVEYQRFKYVSKELVRRRKKHKVIAGSNYRYVKARYAEVKKYKDDYLGYLRKLRREARKKR